MTSPKPETLAAADRQRIKREALFVPCVSKEHLHRWIKVYLGLDLPNYIICDDDVTNPASNSSPMDLVWEIYSKALQGDDEAFQRILAYAARGAYKTVACSVLEILSLLHLGRNVAHAAAIESQASVCAEYVAAYFKRPYLREFIVSKNKRMIQVARYIGPDGSVINQSAWDALPEIEKHKYAPKSNWLKVLVCTMGGMNSTHAPLMVLDELDLAPPKPLEESKAIPCKGENGELPITFMTSSRKFSFGEVQKALDNSQKTGLVVRHWNVIDVTERCKPERHLPNEPRIPIYYNETTLNSCTKEEWELLSPEEKNQWTEQEGYTGCLRNCSLFAICRGRLATKQKSDSKLLISIPEVRSKVSGASPEFVKAQLMCWKPSAEGLIYPNFSRERHMITAAQMAEKITGEPAPKHFNKANLIALMMARGMSFHLGMDFGFTHRFATVLAGLDGNRAFVVDVLSVPGLELNEKVELCKSKYAFLDPTVYPDPAYPSDIKTFRRNGFRCKNFTKDVLLGIDAVRSKLMPGFNKEPEIFFLREDLGVELLGSRMAQYHWIIEPETERATEIPDDKDDDECDALRYLCQNLFGSRTKFTASLHEEGEGPGAPTTQNWMSSKIRQLTGGTGGTSVRGKKGGFIFDV
jgi:hypothetical protein